MRTSKRSPAIGVLSLLASLSALSCSGTGTGNPIIATEVPESSVTLRIGTYTAMNPFDLLIRSAFASVSQTDFCISRVGIRPEGIFTDGYDVFLEDVGMITTTPTSATTLGTVDVPWANYRRIEIFLDDVCGGSPSLRVANSAGTFQTSEQFSVYFEGNVTINGTQQEIPLNLQRIVNELNLVTHHNQVKTRAQAAAGEF